MEEKQTERIEIRVTPTEKQRLQEYAKAHYMTLTAVFRKFCVEAVMAERQE